MPYIEEKSLLFIHIPKNAGKSIEASLGVVPNHFIHRPHTRGVVNSLCKYFLNITQNRYTRKRLFGAYDYVLCAQHLTLIEILMLNLIPEGKLSSTHKFAVVRNPYDRALSTFRHFSGGSFDLDEFKRFWDDCDGNTTKDHNVIAHMRRQKDYIIDIDGNIAVNEIIKYESLVYDYSKMCRRHGWEVNPLSEVRTHKKLDYKSLYDDEAKLIIAERFRSDFECFSYSL